MNIGLQEWEGMYRLYLNNSAETNTAAIEALKSATRAVIGELTARQREALELYFFGGMKQKDIAALWGVDKSAVSRHITRAKERVRKMVVVKEV